MPLIMVTECAGVKSWLKSQWSLIVPDDWLQACVEWIHEENQEGAMSGTEVNDLVYEQWLLCDLREIGAVCLPPDLARQNKYQLTGSYSLQVNSVLDASCSYYSQLQKMTGTENENVNVCATQATQSFTKEKTSRMLMLQLTDGSQDIQAMEYQPISALSTNLQPGTKVVVRGSVLCRLGVLMLTSENIRVLGGEVETLVEENTQENLIRRQLGRNELLSQNPPEQQRAEFNTSANQSAVFNTSANQRAGSGGQVPRTKQSYRANTGAPEPDFPDDDDFLDRVDAAQLDAMEHLQQQQQQWDDDVDYEMLMSEMEFEDGGSSKVLPPAYPSPLPTAAPRVTSARPTTRVTHTVTPSHDASVRQHGQTSQFRRSESFMFDEDDDDFDFEMSSRMRVQSPPAGCGTTSSIPSTSTTPSWSARLGHGKPDKTSPGERPCARNSVKRIRLQDQTSRQQVAPLVSTLAETKVTRFKDSPKTPIKAVAPFNVEITATARPLKTASDKLAIDVCGAPFTYLKTVFETGPIQTYQLLRVKAYISTLLSRLEHNNGTSWSLKVKINDGTASVDVDLGNQMLTNLIGFTAAECLNMKNRAKVDKSLKRKMVEGISQCQRCLVQLCCVLDLELSPTRPRPLVTGHCDVTVSDLDALRDRVHRLPPGDRSL